MSENVAEKQTGAENILWDLSIFYDDTNDPRIDQDLQKLDRMVDKFVETYRSKVDSMDAEDFVDAMKALESIYDLSGRLGSYASLNFSTNTNDAKIGALMQKIQEEGAKRSQKLVFFDLEWNALPEETAQAILADPTLGHYRYHLEAERRYRPYQLSEAEEKVLIEKDVTGASAWTRFFTQLIGNVKPVVDGQALPMPLVLTMVKDADREKRHKAADAITKALEDRKMELTYIFNVLATDKASDDRLRTYPNWISSRNLSNKSPDEVVDALIKTVTSNYDIVARHYEIKRKLLGYDELFDYDRYAPLNLKESESFYTWDEARQIVINAFKAFSPRMGEIANKFFEENWIHAPVLDGKRGGAFASPTVPSAHPFVMVNFTGKATDVMTLAHELGHGLHMYLSSESQGLFGLYTPLTTAETASVFAEMLVFQDLMDKETDPEVRLSMIAEKIEDTFATVFRQVSMNRFEEKLHTGRREEGELSTERLNEFWMETQQAMFLDSVTMRKEYEQWWSYIPHFLHTPGYVYAYAFGQLLVMALYQLYQERGESFIPEYIELLAAGDSDYPHHLLAKVGVDLLDPSFWEKGIQLIAELVDQEEALAKELFPERFN